MDVFIDWAKQQGIESPDVAVQKTAWAGNGLVITKPHDNDHLSALVHIPYTLLITAPQILSRSDSPIFRDTVRQLFSDLTTDPNLTDDSPIRPENERLCLRLFLVFEKYVASTSLWKPYIDILPTLESLRQTHVLLMDEDQVLQGTQLANSVYSKRLSLEQELNRLQKLASQKNDKMGWLADISLDWWLWADVVFWSRVVSLGSSEEQDSTKLEPVANINDHTNSNNNNNNNNNKNKNKNNSRFNNGDLALIPFFDFANHASTPNIRWQLGVDGLDLVRFENGPSVLVPGQELFLSYGEKSNQELLFLHGFCLDDNPVPSQVKLPIMPFLDLSEIQNQEGHQKAPLDYQKVVWLRSKAIRPVLTFQKPLSDLYRNDVHKLFSKTWLGRDSLAIMYLVVCDEDDSIEFDAPRNDLLSMDGLSLESNKDQSAIRTAHLNDHVLNTLEDILEAVAQHPRLEVIQLRVVMLLLDAVTYHLDSIRSGANIKTKENLVSVHVEKYRAEEEACLKNAVEQLIELRDQLMVHPVVVAYLSQ
ncbi:hypothetical protein J3Q64DRAFT_1853861 [Phycomyces blakesleeanus]|uniref:SET domain-containing protein n=1 Tax=Phycomyces blakesleeanus TaxID=4837 RepID=A0ABR3AHS6_PHYBL